MSPFEAPGESDLTVDVDFGRLRRLAHGARLSVAGPVPQGGFLMSLGAETRLNQLTRANPAETNELYAGLRRLVDPEDMGTRFNAICISSEGLPEPAGF
jgi:SAM-dependent MidA family methyltransferase